MSLELTEKELALIKSQILGPNALDEHVDGFVAQCEAVDLHPFSGHVWGQIQFKTENRNKPDEYKRPVLVFGLTIDGMRWVAERTGLYRGQGGPWWCGMDGVWKEVWDGAARREAPLAAKVDVYRAGFDSPVVGIVHWDEFAADTSTWNKMGAHMLAKCAESFGLKRTFPGLLGRAYIPEEMEQVFQRGDVEESKPRPRPEPRKPSGNAPPAGPVDDLPLTPAQMDTMAPVAAAASGDGLDGLRAAVATVTGKPPAAVANGTDPDGEMPSLRADMKAAPTLRCPHHPKRALYQGKEAWGCLVVNPTCGYTLSYQLMDRDEKPWTKYPNQSERIHAMAAELGFSHDQLKDALGVERFHEIPLKVGGMKDVELGLKAAAFGGQQSGRTEDIIAVGVSDDELPF